MDEDSTKSLVAEIRSLRARRRLRVMGLAQDVAGVCAMGVWDLAKGKVLSARPL